MTIIHHAGKAGVKPKMIAQDTYARKQYAHKHFSAPRRAGIWPRSCSSTCSGRGVTSRARRRRQAQRRPARDQDAVNRAEPPFGAPPATAFPVVAETRRGRGVHA
jgi:hypothetical protein